MLKNCYKTVECIAESSYPYSRNVPPKTKTPLEEVSRGKSFAAGIHTATKQGFQRR